MRMNEMTNKAKQYSVDVLTYSSSQFCKICMKTSHENLYTDTGAQRVNNKYT